MVLDHIGSHWFLLYGEKYFHRRNSVIQVWNDMTVNRWQHFECLMHSFYVGLTDAISYDAIFLSLNFDLSSDINSQLQEKSQSCEIVFFSF